MSWLSFLGGDNVKKGMEVIDDAFYTDQEKADMKSKLLDDYRPFKLAQRLIAKEIINMFKVLFYLEILLSVIGLWYNPLWDTLSTLNGLEIVIILGWSYLAVVSLYFTGGVVNSAQGLLEKLKR